MAEEIGTNEDTFLKDIGGAKTWPELTERLFFVHEQLRAHLTSLKEEDFDFKGNAGSQAFSLAMHVILQSLDA